ncbi:hypothetical protein OHB01_23130 [Microbispora hainanensis]|uniref:hypothetical protein n=1 Tax=Microbispora hainanensis TaxID=568844 RepID=UPI002E2E10E5|nr:hypothetical protein [Microbispora hainanensis]
MNDSTPAAPTTRAAAVGRVRRNTTGTVVARASRPNATRRSAAPPGSAPGPVSATTTVLGPAGVPGVLAPMPTGAVEPCPNRGGVVAAGPNESGVAPRACATASASASRAANTPSAAGAYVVPTT